MESSHEVTDYSDYYFNVEFPTCNSFRQVLEFLNQSHKTVPLIFSADKLSIRKPNDSETIIFDGCIYAHNLTKYYVNPEELEKAKLKMLSDPTLNEEEKNKDPEIFIHIPITPLLSKLKSCQKRQKISIFQKKKGESYITVKSGESANIIIDPSKELPIDLVLENPLPTNTPNITTQLDIFQYSATGCGRISDKISNLLVYKHGIKIRAESTQGWSTIPRGSFDGEQLCEISLPGDTMKSISKLSSLCDEGIVRIYCEDSSHIRLEIPISVIGVAHIYLMAPEDKK